MSSKVTLWQGLQNNRICYADDKHDLIYPNLVTSQTLDLVLTSSENYITLKLVSFVEVRQLFERSVFWKHRLMSEWEKIQPTLAQLKEKYSALAASSDAADQNGANAESAALHEMRAHLDNLKICRRCQGLGLITEVYNFVKKDVNCPECDGEGLKEKQ